MTDSEHGALVGVAVHETDPSTFHPSWAEAWHDWRPLMDWEIALTYEDGHVARHFTEKETGAHQHARRYLEQIVPIAGMVS